MTTPTPRSLIHHLPPEILQHCLSQIRGSIIPYPAHKNRASEALSKSTISSCRLTCKYLNTIALPFHFRTITLGSRTAVHTPAQRCVDRIARLRDILVEEPSIALSVRTLWIYGFRPADGADRDLISALWSNEALAGVCVRLTALTAFGVVAQGAFGPGAGAAAVKWDGTLGEEMQRALRVLVSRPSVMSLTFSHLTALPVDLIMGCPNLRYLDVEYIDERVTGDVRRDPESELVREPGDGWNVESIKVGRMCDSLLKALGRARDTLKELTIILCEQHPYSTILHPHLNHYTSLTTLRVHIPRSANPISIGHLTAFLYTQFTSPSLCITAFALQVTGIQDSDFCTDSSAPVCARPPQWQHFESALLASFPHLSTLVFDVAYPIPGGCVERLIVFVVWVLQVIVAMPSVGVVLRYRVLGGGDVEYEREMVVDGSYVDVAGYIWRSFGKRVGGL